MQFFNELIIFLDGQYIYINSFTKTMPNANAVLTSPKLKVSTPTLGCLKYDINMINFWFLTYLKWYLINN